MTKCLLQKTKVIIFLEILRLICVLFALPFTKRTSRCMSSTHELELCATMYCNVELTQATGCSFCDAQGKYHAN